MGTQGAEGQEIISLFWRCCHGAVHIHEVPGLALPDSVMVHRFMAGDKWFCAPGRKWAKENKWSEPQKHEKTRYSHRHVWLSAPKNSWSIEHHSTSLIHLQEKEEPPGGDPGDGEKPEQNGDGKEGNEPPKDVSLNFSISFSVSYYNKLGWE